MTTTASDRTADGRTPQRDRPRPETRPGTRPETRAETRAEPRAGGRSERIPGLDGLRAVAVIAVIAYHLWPTTLPGGFLGVDVFFVVSGFLITTLLLRQVEVGGRVHLADFWRRRARRLLPALVTVMVVGVIAARIVEPDLLVGVRRQVVGALTFTTNWLEIAAGSSYFDATAPELFQPFWSLAIEEQFYLLWPVLLVVLLATRPTWRSRAAIVGGAAVASALAMALLFTPGTDPTRVYYGTATHAFGLLAGAAAAFAWAGGRSLLPARHATWVPLAGGGVLALLVATLHADGSFTYRGGIVLGSLAALALVAGCTAPGGSRYVRALQARPAVWVGERSYGLYLWHWPVILVVGAAFGDAPGSQLWWRTPALALALTFVLAALSHRFVETPVRRRGFRATTRTLVGSVVTGGRRPQVAAAAGVAVVLVATVVVLTAPAQSSTQRAVEDAQRQVDERATATPAPSGAPTRAPGAPVPADGSTVVAFGDSVLSAAAPTLFQEMPKIAVDAKPIRKWLDAPDLVQAAVDAGTLRPVVVLNFGTNGGFQFDGSEAALTRTLDLLGPDRQVLVVTVVGVSYWVPAANARLRELVADRPNVHVVDWNGYLAKHPGLLHADRTHPNMAGVVAYEQVLRAALDDLSG
ncbi:acyltransferase family protein [Cellulomonas composti]|uniref:Acyltransferase n=1 Tax=Cellulomonas composti TaxID=266130 RepID=A0A511JA00_9CELL|nr:acyltransferase family protein [Cellulomonas composti]GEL94533.1 acyltransferase [Cellulomonas composti]